MSNLSHRFNSATQHALPIFPHIHFSPPDFLPDLVNLGSKKFRIVNLRVKSGFQYYGLV